MLAQGGSYAAGNDVDRAHLFVEAAKRAVAETDRLLEADGAGGGQAITRLSQSRMESLMQDYVPGSAASVPGTGAAFAGGDPGATGFVVADGDGLAIACEVTLNRPFGNGRVIPGTGVILAAPPAYVKGLKQLVEQLAARRLLLAVCGNPDDPTGEVWSRQLGVWMYLPGVDHQSDIALLCAEARHVLEKIGGRFATSGA